MTKDGFFHSKLHPVVLVLAELTKRDLSMEDLIRVSGYSNDAAHKLRNKMVDLGTIEKYQTNEGVSVYRMHRLTAKGKPLGEKAVRMVMLAGDMDRDLSR